MTTALPVVRRVKARLTAAMLDERRDAGQRFPIVAPGTCTFAFHGPVISVRLAHFGVGLPEDLSFEPVAGSEWWLLALAVPLGTRLEYKLDVVDSFGNRFIEDPLNPNVASHPFGANSVCEASGYAEPLWARHADDVPRGAYSDISLWSDAYGRDTAVTVYRAATIDGPAPLVVVHDGGDYLRYAEAGMVLDNLVHGGVIPPVVAAFIQPRERLVEYANDDRHATYLTKELVPRMEAEFGALAEPAMRCLVGASFGAVASLSAAVAAPGFFGRLLLQSGSFAGAGKGCRARPEPLWRPVQRFVAGLLARPEAVSDRVFVSCGAYESLICENRALVPVLAGTGMDVRFVESLDGHNWACWRDTIGLGLPWLFSTTE